MNLLLLVTRFQLQIWQASCRVLAASSGSFREGIIGGNNGSAQSIDHICLLKVCPAPRRNCSHVTGGTAAAGNRPVN